LCWSLIPSPGTQQPAGVGPSVGATDEGTAQCGGKGGRIVSREAAGAYQRTPAEVGILRHCTTAT